MAKTGPTTVSGYMKTLPAPAKRALNQVRQMAMKSAPGAEEVISYRIPALRLGGRNIVYYAAWSSHVGLYPIPSGNALFRSRIAPYVHGRGTLRFPLGEPLPLDLVEAVVRLRVKECARKP